MTWSTRNRAPVSSTISRAASRWAASAWSGWSCFSNRVDASERRPSAFDVLSTFGPTHVAASIRTRVVASETSEIWPPMIPAMPDGPSASPTSAIEESKVRSTSSRVVIRSPSSAHRTTIFAPRTSSRSKACIGWPVSSIA